MYQGQSDALVVNGCEYQFVLSRPDMKRLKINLYWNDNVGVDMEACGSLSTADRLVRCEEDVRLKFPELVCVGAYPPAATKFSVPFKLADVTPIRRKPYNMSRERRLWLKKELQNMLEAEICPSVSKFASPITLAYFGSQFQWHVDTAQWCHNPHLGSDLAKRADAGVLRRDGVFCRGF